MKYLSITGLRIRYFFALLFVLTCITGCDQSHSNKPVNDSNVLIVTFDTTRSDHIGAYKKKADAYTPNLDAMAQDGVVYENALAPIPITLPSHSSIMTGKVPFAHGVRDNGLFNLSENHNTIAEILKSYGYQTAAAIGSFPLTSQFGINQGFDYYNDHIAQKFEDIFGERTLPKDSIFFDERNSTQVNDAIMPWFEKHSSKPFFAWIHYFDPHHPHEPPNPYNQTFAHDLYQGEIAFSDESFGKIIAQLKRLNVYDNTLIIFTSDHGEGNNEHNEATHSLLIYNSTLHVPLIVKYPNQQYANTRISNWTGLVDIFPTVMDVLGIEISDDIQGEILPLGDSGLHKEYYSETLSPRFSRGWGEQRGLIKNGYKYIYGPQKELYNIELDPNEVNNIILENKPLAESMESDLQDYIDENRPEDNNIGSTHDVDAKTLETLRGLGYIQSTSGAVDQFEEKLDDSGDAPQLHVATISTYSTVKNLMFKGDYIEAIRYINILLSSDPDNLEYKELLIKAEIFLGNFNHAKKLLEELPIDSNGIITPSDKLNFLANIYFFEKDYITAKNLYQDAENIKPSLEGQYRLAKIAHSENNLLKQQEHLENILSIDPTFVKILDELAISYAIDGNLIKAEQTFIRAINNNPYNSKNYYNYGAFLISMTDYSSAEIQFKKAIEYNHNYLLAHYALIETLMNQYKVDEAKIALEIMTKIDPENPMTLEANKLTKDL